MKRSYSELFKETISIEALFNSWEVFKKGKRHRADVQQFFVNLESRLFALQRELESKVYNHDRYRSFFVQDPKVRHIRKATVRDRIVHQMLTTKLNELFESKFINDLYSSRPGKGTHRGVKALRKMSRKVSRNGTQSCWALKCDIRRFYDSVDHKVLLAILHKKISDSDFLWLCRVVIESFHCEEACKKGMPIGNQTSQIFTNIYLNELDQYIKHKLKIKYYVRYADDFIVLNKDKKKLLGFVFLIRKFLYKELKLELHPQKICIRELKHGIDFLGYVVLKKHIVLRTKTKRRMLKKLKLLQEGLLKNKITKEKFSQSLQSYLGVLKHADANNLSTEIRNQYGIDCYF